MKQAVAPTEVALPAFLTQSEVSRLLGVSPTTVSRWVREVRLTCQVTLGGHHRFDREQVEQILRWMLKERLTVGKGGCC